MSTARAGSKDRTTVRINGSDVTELVVRLVVNDDRVELNGWDLSAAVESVVQSDREIALRGGPGLWGWTPQARSAPRRP